MTAAAQPTLAAARPTDAFDRAYAPFIVGVTGHRDIRTEVIPSLEAAVRAELHALLRWAAPTPILVLSPMAEGADQLVARVALSLRDGLAPAERWRLQVVVPLPMPAEEYAADFAPGSAADRFLTDVVRADGPAEHVAVLSPVLSPSASNDVPVDFTDQRQRNRQYQQAGLLIARLSHVLLALWDGQETGKPGGTDQIVRFRLDGELPEADGIPGSATFARWRVRASALEPPETGPIVRFVTPRSTATDPAILAAASRRELLWPRDHAAEDFISADWLAPEAGPIPTTPGWPIRGAEAPPVFDMLRAYGARDVAEVVGVPGDDPRANPGRGRALFTQALAGLAQPHQHQGGPQEHSVIERLRPLFAAADATAQRHQTVLYGRLKRLPGSLALDGVGGWLTAVLPVGVLLFELYAKHLVPPGVPATLPLIAYLVGIGAALLAYAVVSLRERRQDRFEDSRVIAEATRVQYFWALAGLGQAVGMHYPRIHGRVLRWVRHALRGAELWALLTPTNRPQANVVLRGWLIDQHNYFAARARTHHHLAQWFMRQRDNLFLVGMALAGGLLLHDALLTTPFLSHTLHDALIVATATAPASAGFFHVLREKLAFEEHARSYNHMRAIFATAIDRVTGTKPTNQPVDAASAAVSLSIPESTLRETFYELGREALAENSEWYMTHRERPIEVAQG